MARGTLYLDDGKSFDYKQGRKVYVEITWDNGKLESKLIESGEDLALIGVFALQFALLSPGMETPVWLEKVLVLGARPGSGPAQVDKTNCYL